MEIFSFNPATLFSFLLTLMRISLVVFLLPFYGGETLPATVKACICLVLTLALWPQLSFPGELMPAHPWGIAVVLLKELVLGLLLGLSVAFIFAGIQTGGEIMGFQMGFTMVTLADPQSGAQVSITSHLLYMVALLIFLALDGHLALLRGLAGSFALIPPGGLTVGGPLAGSVLELSAGMFSVAVQIAGPIIAALFMVELALALMGRAAPQMNLLTLGFPLKIAVGFFFIGMIFSIIALRMEDTIIQTGPLLDNLMRRGQ
ncbi:MAG: flagellar biosynthetic protein FliR [Desulfovibrio sp.]|jgi:flagellar biosynthetic protein FliR|nr:flagellar biosynthetic protein FliR [Desulfovibrio sp.]